MKRKDKAIELTYFDNVALAALTTINIALYIISAYFIKEYCTDGFGHWNPGYTDDAHIQLVFGVVMGIFGIFISLILFGVLSNFQ